LVPSSERITVAMGERVPFSVRAVDASGADVEAPLRVTGPRSAVSPDEGYVEGLAQGEYEIVATLVVGPGEEPPHISVPVVVTWPAVERLEIDAAPGALYAPRYVSEYNHPDSRVHDAWVAGGLAFTSEPGTGVVDVGDGRRGGSPENPLYYEGGLRVVDVSSGLMGNLYTQGREIAIFKSASPGGYAPNATMVWAARPHKGHVLFSDTNFGLWAVRLLPEGRPVS
jgi:hypothetical protein